MAATENAQTSPQFTNSFTGDEAPIARERNSSVDHTNADEWDASKTPPSRFQKRKGSIYATPNSRDGHIERNRDAVEEFHTAHSKRWSFSRGKKDATAASYSASSGPEKPRKASQASQASQ